MSEKIKRLLIRISRALKPPFGPIIRRIHGWARSGKLGAGETKLQTLAYNLLGEKTSRTLPLFKDVDVNLQRSEVRISFKAYANWAILASMLASVVAIVLVPLSLVLVGHLPLVSSLLFGIGGAMFAGAFTIVAFYVYPIFRAEGMKKNIEGELPFTTSYMAILAGAGVSPDRIFRSLTNTRVSSAVSVEAKTVVRDVELFGFDVISALENASKRTPSQRFKEMVEGFIGTIHSGGNLSAYLTSRSRQYMDAKRITLRKFADTLSILAEFYVTILVAGPLIFVVMLAVMGMLGGGSGLMNPVLLLSLLTYVGIPMGSLAFLVVVDIVSPGG